MLNHAICCGNIKSILDRDRIDPKVAESLVLDIYGGVGADSATFLEGLLERGLAPAEIVQIAAFQTQFMAHNWMLPRPWVSQLFGEMAAFDALHSTIGSWAPEPEEE